MTKAKDQTTDTKLQITDLERAFTRHLESPGKRNDAILQGVRPIRKGKPNIRVVHFPSPKNGWKYIACEGRLEGAMALNLELHTAVSEYRGQPFLVPGSKGPSLVPDFAVRTGGRIKVVDVKPSARLRSDRVADRMKRIEQALAPLGIEHRVITELDLEREPHRQIRLRLRRGLYVPLTQYQRDQLLHTIRAGPVSVHDLRRRATDLGLSPFCVERLAVLGIVTFQINAPWSEKTLLGENNGTRDY